MLWRKGAAHHGLWELEFLLPRRHCVVVNKCQPQPPLRLQLAQVAVAQRVVRGVAAEGEELPNYPVSMPKML